MTTSSHIYALIDPRDNEIKYVGKSVNVGKRLINHIHSARLGATDKKSKWIVDLINSGLKPTARILETCFGEAWREAEIFWISSLEKAGYNLFNMDSGGGGFHIRDERTRKRLSQITSSRMSLLTPDERRQLTENARKTSGSPERSAKLGKTMKKFLSSQTPEFRKRWVESAVRGKKRFWENGGFSEEERRAISEAHKNPPKDMRERISKGVSDYWKSLSPEEKKSKIEFLQKKRREKRDKDKGYLP